MPLGAVVDATEVPMSIAAGIGLTGPLGYRPSAPVVKALRDRRLCRPSRPGGGSPAGRPSSTLGSAARPRCCGRSLVGRLRAWPHVTDLLRRAGEAAPWAGRSVFSGLRSLGFPAARWVMCAARAYTPSRGWSDADMDAGFDRLQRRG